MDYETLLNKILRLPQKKGVELLDVYQQHHRFTTFSEQQRLLDVMTLKTTQLARIKEQVIYETVFALTLMSSRKDAFSKSAFSCIKEYPMLLWIEGIGNLEPKSIISLLNNFHNEFNSNFIETCIINLPDNMQSSMINKYRKEIDANGDLYYNFYYSVCPEARLTLDKLYPNKINNKLLLLIKDAKEEDIIDLLKSNMKELVNYNPDEIIEMILLKVTSADILSSIFILIKDIIISCSDSKFEFLLKRYQYLPYVSNEYEDEEKIMDNYGLFETFKEKFYNLGLAKTLKLFNNIKNYGINEFSEKIIYSFLDIAYEDKGLKDYINDQTLEALIKHFVKSSNQKDYTLNELEEYVNNCGRKNKLIKDDYILAIIACGDLLKKNIINNQHPLYIKLRDLFNEYLFNNLEKDGTIDRRVDFNGLFYRLAKGSIPFENVFLTKTYRGLIYLSKSGNNLADVDYITNFLTDEQVLNLNISPLLKWKKTLNLNENMERIALQLLLFFGKEKGEYLIKANIASNRMESLFDSIKYKNIQIDDKGNPIINEELNKYLFGYGKMNNLGTVINRLIRGEIMEFEKYFSELCNNFYEIKDKCNGILSIKRIIRELERVELPIELKPNEKHYEGALKELNTFDKKTLEDAVQLLNEARKRKSSTIPKVKGDLGDFTYEMLDLNDPLNIAVGYLSHCCFKIYGMSYSSLIQALKSRYGRIFVVYYKGSFLTQSWVWRNGDVVCFDSVESGSPVHGAYKDDIHLVDVYLEAANKIMNISRNTEDELQAIKLITVGRSDFVFSKELRDVDGDVPRPLEKDLYLSDSQQQKILAGNMESITYGAVGASYKDPRKYPTIIRDINKCDLDIIDDSIIKLDSLRYEINNIEIPLDIEKCKEIYYGDDWYIIVYDDNTYENGVISDDEEATREYNRYYASVIKNTEKKKALRR